MQDNCQKTCRKCTSPGVYLATPYKNRRKMAYLRTNWLRAPTNCDATEIISYCVEISYRRIDNSDQDFVVYGRNYGGDHYRSDDLYLPNDVTGNTWTIARFNVQVECRWAIVRY